MLNGISLFSGIGGIDVALSDYVQPVAYCEIDPYCQGVLFSRMARRDLSSAPIWSDIRTLHTRASGGLPCAHIDIIYGGFPCQDISVAGKGKGLEGERSGLFFEIVRLAKEIKPKFIFLENVPAITSRGGLQVVREIAEMGYDCRWCVISAASVGALHRRERWFLMGYAKHNGSFEAERRGSVGEKPISRGSCQSKQEEEKQVRESEGASGISTDVADTNNAGRGASRYDFERKPSIIEQWNDPQPESSGYSKDVADANGESERRLPGGDTEKNSMPCKCGNDGNTYSKPSEQANTGTESELSKWGSRRESSRQYWPFESRAHWQEIVSTICRVDDGVPNRVDRLKCLGNAVVPIQVKEAFEILMGIK